MLKIAAEYMLLMAAVLMGFYHGLFTRDFAHATYWIALSILYTQWVIKPKVTE